MLLTVPAQQTPEEKKTLSTARLQEDEEYAYHRDAEKAAFCLQWLLTPQPIVQGRKHKIKYTHQQRVKKSGGFQKAARKALSLLSVR